MSAIPGFISIPVASTSSGGFIEVAGFDRKFTIPEAHRYGKCRNISEFERKSHLGEGAFGTVYQGKDKVTGEIVALKKLKTATDQCMPMHCTREITILKNLNHENIVNLHGVAVGKKFESTYLILEFCPYDLAKVIDKRESDLETSQIKCIMKQLFIGLEYIHKQGVLHRDLTVTNILFNSSGVLKISDFGFSRTVSSGEMTPNVVSRWYRAPEILLGSKLYTSAIDLWSAGCVFAELLLRKPLFQADSDCKTIKLMIDCLGVPTESIWPGLSELPLIKDYNLEGQPYNKLSEIFAHHPSACVALLHKLFLYNPKSRFSATQSLQHAYFMDWTSVHAKEELLKMLQKLYSRD